MQPGTGTLELSSRYGTRTEEFSALMQHRVREILLVASLYDAFVLEEDGQLSELISKEYYHLDLNLRYAPRFTRAASAASALEKLKSRKYDMVVSTPRLPDMEIETFARQVKQESKEVPIGVLAAHAWDLPRLENLRASGEVDWLFLWQGDVTALMAMIKQVEDRRNADHDVIEGGVQAIILVEDEVRFYSVCLPQIYFAVTKQTGRLMAEGLNQSHRLLRIRARPKILLAQDYEEAWRLYAHYAGNLLGIISDVAFPRNGKVDMEAGIGLARRIRQHDGDIPILLQSLEKCHEAKARTFRASFLHKRAPNLLEKLKEFILDNFGFGDFVFRFPDGKEVGRARDIRQMVHLLSQVPDGSVVYHASRNDFSSWLKARTEFDLASLLRPRKVAEFSSASDLRKFLIKSLTTYLRGIQSHVITDFEPDYYDEFVAFAKIGSGSMGGKGRGLAYMHKMLASKPITIDGARISIPQTVVVASDHFESFLDDNDLRKLVQDVASQSDQQILDAFRSGHFSDDLRKKLTSFLKTVTKPIAVRSSSILEDSIFQPFAGVYATLILPNSHSSPDVRLAQLLEAIKVVYASTYFSHSRAYIEATPYRIEEEHMAVLVQRLVGSDHDGKFYPTLSGMAASYNFYPFGPMKPDQGVAQLALGLGKSVVDGFGALRFCPEQPQVLPQFSAVEDILRNAQRRFFALDMSRNDVIPSAKTDVNLLQLEAKDALDSKVGGAIASTYLRTNDSITSGLVAGGAPIVTFASLLKGRVMPLPKVISEVLRTCQEGIGCAAEIEFAVDLRSPGADYQTFHVLQVRPMVIENMAAGIQFDREALQRAVVSTDVALGHGRTESLTDLVVVNPKRLDRKDTAKVASHIEQINQALVNDGRNCILIGPGRWGSRDPWLGIPVTWPQISATRVIVETDFRDLQVEPSHGSHFFHNLTCFGIALFSVHKEVGTGVVNWEWLDQQPAGCEEMEGTIRHIRLLSPVKVLVDGATGQGAILASPASELEFVPTVA